jgi:hypothetical protein
MRQTQNHVQGLVLLSPNEINTSSNQKLQKSSSPNAIKVQATPRRKDTLPQFDLIRGISLIIHNL